MTGDADRERFDVVMADGRALVSNVECSARHVPPFLLATVCEGTALDGAIRRVSAFALVLSAIITGVVAFGAAPWPIVFIAVLWGGPALGALAYAARRRRTLGRFLVDFEGERLVHWAVGTDRSVELSLSSDASVEVEPVEGEEAMRWIELRASRARLRLARADAREAAAIGRLFRTYGIAWSDYRRVPGRDSSA